MNLLLVEAPPLDVWGQMALDEWFLDRPGTDFHLRFYRWEGGPAASYGYGVPRAAAGRELEAHLLANSTRRLTGGGVNRHGADVTFSCIFPYPVEAAWKPLGVYRMLHEAIGRGFQNAGFDICIRATPVSVIPDRFGHGMRQPVALDLMALDGSRLLGGALRRRRGSVLYQGSIQMPDARSRADDIESAVRCGIEMAVHREGWQTLSWHPDDAFARLRDKYRSPAWRNRR